jgi:hypothetical protein
MDAKICPHCEKPLQDDREVEMRVCFVCRRFGLLLGVWPSELYKDPPITQKS